MSETIVHSLINRCAQHEKWEAFQHARRMNNYVHQNNLLWAIAMDLKVSIVEIAQIVLAYEAHTAKNAKRAEAQGASGNEPKIP